MHHQLEKSSNGLATLFIDSPGAAAGSVQMWFRAGSSLENRQNQGIAHFLEHMFFKGTPGRPGNRIAEEVESFGGELNAFTSFDYTCYYINSPHNHLLDSVDILLDMVSNAEFKQEDLIPERGVVFEEFRRSIDNPAHYAFHQLQKMCFMRSYAHPILGNEKTIKNFSREQLISFRNNFYNQSNALLITAGDIKKQKQKICQTIERYQMPKGAASKFSSFRLKPKSLITVHRKDVHLSMLYMAVAAPGIEDGNAAAEEVAIGCLGNGESSRLYQSIVLQKSLANTALSYTMFQTRGGLHIFRFAFPHKNLQKVLGEFKKVLGKAVTDNLNSTEVRKIKDQYVASKVYERETVEQFAFSLGHSYAQNGNIHCEEDFIVRIKNTTTNMANNALKNLFLRPRHLSLQIPLNADLKKSQRILDTFGKAMETLQKKIKTSQSSPPAVQTSRFDSQLKHIHLKKGVSLLYRKNDMTPTFIMEAWLAGGLLEEHDRNNGIHYLLAKTLTKGYDNIPYDTISADLEAKSAGLSGFSGRSTFGLSLHGQSCHFRELCKHFEGTLLRADFKMSQIKHQKEITLRILENQKKDPVKTCFKEFDKLMFEGHPYKRNALGTPQSLRSLSRKSLCDLHARSLNNKEILITYCGDLELEQVQEALEPIFTQLPGKTPRRHTGKAKIKKAAKTFHVIPFDREQTQILTAIPGAKFDSPEHIHLKMLTAHLSGSSSELFVEARDRQGLCYTTRPIHIFSRDKGYWGIYMASGYDKVEAALTTIEKITKTLRDNGVTRKEFVTIKKMLEGKMLLDIQTNQDYSNFYSIPLLYGYGLDFQHKQLAAMKKMKYETFQVSLKKLLSRQWKTIIVGRPHKS